MEEGRSSLKILTGKPAGKWPWCGWEDNIRIGINTRNGVDSTQDRDYW